jgi:hypothetical protein
MTGFFPESPEDRAEDIDAPPFFGFRIFINNEAVETRPPWTREREERDAHKRAAFAKWRRRFKKLT